MYLFLSFRNAAEILDYSTYQGIPVPEKSGVQRSIRGGNDYNSTSKLKQLLIFAKQYVAALRDNFSSRFNCHTFELCQKFQTMFDPSPYFYPSDSHSIAEPLSDMDTFSGFTDDIPFVSKTEQEVQTLLFQLRETRKILIQLVSALQINGIGEQIKIKSS